MASYVELELVAIRVRDVLVRVKAVDEEGTKSLLFPKLSLAAGEPVRIELPE